MIELLNLPLIGGLLAAAAPVVIHLLHRRKVRRVDWGAMRFLLETVARRRRRLVFDEWLLLAVRVLIVACLALALTRPALRVGPAAATGAHGRWIRRGRTAAVIVLDDSFSTAAGRSRPVTESMKQLARAYIDTLEKGDEVSVLRLSQLRRHAGEPTYDLDDARAGVDVLEPTAVSSDVAAMLEAGLEQFSKHLNPDAELVLVTDGCRDGWIDSQSAAWKAVLDRVGSPLTNGGRADRPVTIVVLDPPRTATGRNLSIDELAPDRTLISPYTAINLRARVRRHGDWSPGHVLLELRVDGRSRGTKEVELGDATSTEAVFAHTFDRPGSHLVEVVLLRAQDDLPADDRRALAVEVVQGLDVLLVESGRSTGLAGDLGYLEAALDPKGNGAGLFQPTRISVTDFATRDLNDARVVVLGNVAAMKPADLAALERFVVAGGGLLVSAGADTDPLWTNQVVYRDGDGLLPAAFGSAQQPARPASPMLSQSAHPALAAFELRDETVWRGTAVRQYLSLLTDSARGRTVTTLLSLDRGDPLLFEWARGRGKVAMLATTLNLDWSHLALQPAYVPLVRGLVGYLGRPAVPERNLDPGMPLTILIDEAANGSSPAARGPGGEKLEMTRATWEGLPALVSQPLLDAGVVRVTPTSGTPDVHYVVSPDSTESELLPVDDEAVATAFAGHTQYRFHTDHEIETTIRQGGRTAVEVWRWLLAASVALVVIETLLTRWQANNTRSNPRSTVA